MKTAILYIGIGAYVRFWDKFYTTCEQNFLPGTQKHYYFFTNCDVQVPDNVSVLYQDDMGWPFNTMYRFRMFMRIKEILAQYDYVFFFNGNSEVIAPVLPDEVLPHQGEITALQWHVNTDPARFPYETRTDSQACIAPGEGKYYCQGGFYGAAADIFVKMCEDCAKMAETDIDNGIVAAHHDESYINRYFIGRKLRVLDTRYGRPSQWKQPHDAKILFRNKNDVLGRSFLKSLKSADRKESSGGISRFLKKIF